MAYTDLLEPAVLITVSLIVGRPASGPNLQQKARKLGIEVVDPCSALGFGRVGHEAGSEVGFGHG